jgi:hypothetical protein
MLSIHNLSPSIQRQCPTPPGVADWRYPLSA